MQETGKRGEKSLEPLETPNVRCKVQVTKTTTKEKEEEEGKRIVEAASDVVDVESRG